MATFTRFPAFRRSRALRRRVAAPAIVESLEPRALLTAVNLTDYEQLLLELINRGRANPSAEAARYGVPLNEGLNPGEISTDPKQPLAPNAALLTAARNHSQDMLDRDYFAHNTPEGVTPAQRMAAAGYTTDVGTSENIVRRGVWPGPIDKEPEVYNIHRDLYESSGHRRNQMNPNWKEAGTGIRFGLYLSNGTNFDTIMGTENFSARTADTFITGVVYTDSDSDGMYSIGEAIRAGTITATNTSTGDSWSASIGASGGYALEVPDGSYSVTAAWDDNGTDFLAVTSVVVAGQNVKTDFETGSVTPVGISLTAASTTVHEAGSGTSLIVTVTRNGDLGSAVTVNLSSADGTEVALPATVSLPAGQSTTSFSVAGVDDAIIDGNQLTAVTAAVTGYQPGALNVTTVDSTVPQLPSGTTESESARPAFTWTGVSNAADYQLWVNDHSGAVVINASGITGTTYVPSTDLSLGTHYAWVRGRTAGGTWSGWSPIAVYRVRTRSSVQTTGTVSTDDFTISWSDVPGAATWDVWINRITSGTSQYYRNTSVTQTSVAVSDFAPGRYGIWVLAKNASGFSGFWSPMALVTVSVPVSGLAVSGSSLTAVPTLAWDAVTGASQYDVWINNLTTNTSEFVRDTDVSATSLPLSTLTPGAYRGWVRARDEFGGNYAWSSAYDFSYQAASRPLAPAGSGHSATPLFTWITVSGATRYELWVSSLDGGGRVIHQQNLTGTSWTPGQSLSAGNYRIWIRAFDSADATSGWSSSLDFSVAAADSPGASRSAAAASGATLVGDVVDRLFADSAAVLTALEQTTEPSIAEPTVEIRSQGHGATAPGGNGEAVEFPAAVGLVPHHVAVKPVGWAPTPRTAPNGTAADRDSRSG